MEAIDVNVLGSQNVARVAIQQGVKLVVGISTDKASPPVRNTYGLTKALMERLFCAMDSKSDTRFLCVRYGNVAWSTGSVFCLWKAMLANQGWVGTTGPEMYRFFFSVDEAVELVATALLHADESRGKVLSRAMKSARIKDVLEAWAKSDGIKYKTIDGRPGERDEEYLIGEQELAYTEAIQYGDIPHYLISFNNRAKVAHDGVISSRTARKLTEEEIVAFLHNPPLEEL
jgi:UDP-N-acetylglucosamine 4,6-dehydratase/5-epimerase